MLTANEKHELAVLSLFKSVPLEAKILRGVDGKIITIGFRVDELDDLFIEELIEKEVQAHETAAKGSQN
jgi:hypothetical protein